MKQSILLLFLSIVAITSCGSNTSNSGSDDPILNELLSQLDSLNLEDGQALYTEQYNNFISLIAYTEKSIATEMEPTNFTDAEEELGVTKPIVTSVPSEMNTAESLLKNITVTHDFFNPFDTPYGHNEEENSLLYSSALKIENELSDNYLKYSYTLDSIYYKDGTSKKINSKLDNATRFYNLKLVDRITLTINIPSNLRTIVLSNSKKKANLDGTPITLESINKNIAKFRIEGKEAGSYVTTQAKTKSGQIVSYSEQATLSATKDDIEKFKSTFTKYLGEVADKIQDKKYKNKEEFIADLKENMSKVYIPAEGNYQSTTASYQGNIDEVYLYFSENNENAKIHITVPVVENLHKYNLRFKNQKEEDETKVIVDENGTILATIPDGYDASQLNNYYYELTNKETDARELYRFDPEKGFAKVEDGMTRKYGFIKGLTDDWLIVSTTNDPYKYGALDRSGNTVIPLRYSGLKKSDTQDLIIANIGNLVDDNARYTLYDLAGKEIASGDGYLSDFSDGLASVEKNGKKGYINNRGKLIIPFA